MIVNPRPLSAGIPRNLSYGDRSTLLGKRRIPHRLCAYCAHALGGLDLGEELVAEELSARLGFLSFRTVRAYWLQDTHRSRRSSTGEASSEITRRPL